MRAPPFAVLVLVAGCSAAAPEPAPSMGPGAASFPARPAPIALASAGEEPPAPPAHAEFADATRALFVAHCAQCHGEQGDGEGVTQLDRKARSFLDGGFSYGNTKEAILRSITHGIPGTPMPPFEKALSPEQCAALADLVIALGPERIVVDPTESEMVVRERALVVRGKLPPIVAGASGWPRGLAFGTPDGLTFEYRADDVRLVGVRAGRFVNRADWGGRGGDALEMLGAPIDAPDPGRGVFRLDGVALPARLYATTLRGPHVVLTYHVVAARADRGEDRLAMVKDIPSAWRGELGSGYRRSLHVKALAPLVGLEVLAGVCQATGAQRAENATHHFAWCREERRGREGPLAVGQPVVGALVVARAPRDRARVVGDGLGCALDLGAGETAIVDLFTLTDARVGAVAAAEIVAEFGRP